MLLAFTVVAVFGPYMVPAASLRTEQLVLYPLALMFVTRLSMPRAVGKRLAFTAAVWLLPFALGWAVSTYATARGDNQAALYHYLSIADAFLLPTAALIVGLGLACTNHLGADRPSRVFDVLSATSVAIACVNSLVAILQVTIGGFQPALEWFWSGDAVGLGGSVGSLAVTGYRFTGIFNQPIESGIFSSLCLAGWIYLRARSHGGFISSNRAGYFPALVLICVGGVLGGSKVFLGVAASVLAIVVGHVLIGRHHSLRTRISAGASLATGLGALWYGLRLYRGTTRGTSGLEVLLERLGSEDAISVLSGGRIHSQGAAALAFYEDIWQSSPIVGIGLTNQPGPADNAYFWFISISGLIGLTMYLALLAFWAYRGWTLSRDHTYRKQGLLLLGLLGIVLVSGLGAPPLVLNRVGSLLWLFLGASLAMGQPAERAAGTSTFTRVRTPTRHSVTASH